MDGTEPGPAATPVTRNRGGPGLDASPNRTPRRPHLASRLKQNSWDRIGRISLQTLHDRSMSPSKTTPCRSLGGSEPVAVKLPNLVKALRPVRLPWATLCEFGMTCKLCSQLVPLALELLDETLEFVQLLHKIRGHSGKWGGRIEHLLLQSQETVLLPCGLPLLREPTCPPH